jgi:phosphopantothenate-cysteine ligase
LDNFSGGGRGAASTELVDSIHDMFITYRYFIDKGYAVIFLHRRRSLQPFERHVITSHSSNLLDYFTENSADGTIQGKYVLMLLLNLH